MTVPGDPSRWLSYHAEQRARTMALITEHADLTFGEWQARSQVLSMLLAQAGFVSGAATALLSASARRHAVWLTAGWQTGLPLLPLSVNRPDWHLLLQRSGIRQVIIDDGVPVPDHLIAVSAQLADGVVPPANLPDGPRARLPEHEPLLYLSSSGSSGPPKLAAFDAGRIEAAIRATSERLDVRATDCWLACLPMQHVGGLSVVLRALRAGAATVLVERFDPDAIGRAFRAHSVTHISLVPTMLAALLEAGIVPPASLRCALIGGGRLSAMLRTRALACGWPVYVSYGMTETFAAVTIHDPSLDWLPGDAGTPVGDISCDVIAGVAGVGRIRIRGSQVMCGYADGEDDGLTDSAFVSADLGRVAANGHLHVLGRSDLAFSSGGHLVQPDRIEQALARCPGVTAAIVVGVPDERWEHRVVAVYAGDADEAAVGDWCRLHVNSAERPREIVRWAGLPLAGPGKPDRVAALRRLSARPMVDSR